MILKPTTKRKRRQSGAKGAGSVGVDSSFDALRSSYDDEPPARRTKADWAGPTLGDAFKPHADPYVRLLARRMFYKAARTAQLAVARVVGLAPGQSFESRVKAQLSPCYTSYPATPAAVAALGLTAFLEFEARISDRLLSSRLSKYLENPAAADQVSVEPSVYKTVAAIVTRSIEIRLLMEDLSRIPALAAVERYRQFAASQQDLRFRSLPEIVKAVLLYGDLMPDWEEMPNLNPLTRRLLCDLDATSRPFFAELRLREGLELAEMGSAWVRVLMNCLAKYLPRVNPETGATQPSLGPGGGAGATGAQFQTPTAAPDSGRIPPLDAPAPPSLFETNTPVSMAAEVVEPEHPGLPGQPPPGAPSLKEIVTMMKPINELNKAIEKAIGQEDKTEDVRMDLMEALLQKEDFKVGPIQGTPTEGHEVEAELGGGETGRADIFDQALAAGDRPAALSDLLAQAGPVTRSLRRILYPNFEASVETESLQTGGALDPARLALAGIQSTVFRRYRACDKADRRGRPVLLIACDASGSLNAPEMRMVKILTAAWLQAAVRSPVQLLAGLYHSGPTPFGDAPLVEWVYHPKKVATLGPGDAVAALASLPESGTGRQSDALSLAFMLKEAFRLARGRMVYLVLITDGQWNQSFSGTGTGLREVTMFFEETYRETALLHTTLIVIGNTRQSGLENLVQRTIQVTSDELKDPTAVASKVATYVASTVRERRRATKPA
jgi:hypothetical protein